MTFLPFARKAGMAAVAGLMLGAAPAALFAETPADTLVIADAIDDIVSLDPHEAYEFSGLDLINNVYDGLIELDPTTLDTGARSGRKLVGGRRRHDLYLQDEVRASPSRPATR